MTASTRSWLAEASFSGEDWSGSSGSDSGVLTRWAADACDCDSIWRGFVHQPCRHIEHVASKNSTGLKRTLTRRRLFDGRLGDESGPSASVVSSSWGSRRRVRRRLEGGIVAAKSVAITKRGQSRWRQQTTKRDSQTRWCRGGCYFEGVGVFVVGFLREFEERKVELG